MTDPVPADPLILTRKGGAALWTGWFAIGMAALSVGYRQLHYEVDPRLKLVLALVAAVLGLGGGLLLTRRHRQTISISHRDRKIVFEDGPFFHRTRQIVTFRTIRVVEVETYTDSSHDDSVPAVTHYRVVARLLDGRVLPLSDFFTGEEEAARLGTQIRALIDAASASV